MTVLRQSNNGTQPSLHERPTRTLILAVCQHYKDWFLNVGMHIIKPEYFDTAEEQAYIKFMRNYALEFDELPSNADIAYEFDKSHPKVDKDLMADLMVEIDAIINTGKLEYGKKQTIEFAKYQAKTNAFILGAQLRNEGKSLDAAFTMLEDAEQIGLSTNEWRSPSTVDQYAFDMKWIIDGMMKQGKVNLFYGESGCGKTWLELYKAACIVLGKPFMGRKTVKSAVMWIDEENREDEMMERLYSLRAAMTAEERTEFDKYFTFRTLGKTCTERFNLNDGMTVRRLIKRVQQIVDRPVVVVFDSMGAVSYSAETTVSDNKTAIKIMNILADITIKTRATISAIHHPTKDKSNMFGGVFMTNLVDLNVEISRVDVGDKSRHILQLSTPKDRKGLFDGFLVEFFTDGRDSLGRAINPRFINPDDIDVASLKSGKNAAALQYTWAIEWLSTHQSAVLGLSMTSICTDIKTLAELDGVKVYKDGWKSAITCLVDNGVYKWNTDNVRSSKRSLLTGESYSEFKEGWTQPITKNE